MHFTTSTLLLALLTLTSAQRAPAKPQQTLDANTLSACSACASIVQSWTNCQSLSYPSDVTLAGKEAKQCLCNRSWLGSSITCRDCILLASGRDGSAEAEFLDMFAQGVTNMVTSCGSAGGSVTVKNGASCAYAYQRGTVCVRFEDQKESWASTEGGGEVEKVKAKMELPEGVKATPAPGAEEEEKDADKKDEKEKDEKEKDEKEKDEKEKDEKEKDEKDEDEKDESEEKQTSTKTTATGTAGTSGTASSATASSEASGEPEEPEGESSAVTLTWTASAVAGAFVAAVMAML
ncbi:hypothetical protein EX30DRAFT_221992 [Ascodesmis nigricans]|uniref:Uncharacterized protein n=1 Tax=Ascodesmis nigricans TaxID=341454 RepID=A0A4S2MZS3_9PEZI|nr:hypothetical protein EX30DRAFT_221992 [Ascodesmis nigricans]